ncbi:Auxin-induced protein 5NG4 [Hordeum vulgare]|nr:Auxin-induced protein 5NG4 [Hordeum vulgare]
MQYNGPTFELPPTVPERWYPAGIVVERTLRMWAFSRWRGAREFAECLLRAGFAHVPVGSPVMFRLEEVRRNSGTPPIGLTVTFTKRFDAYYLLGKVFWCG